MEKSCITSSSVHHCTVAPLTPSTGGGRVVIHGKSKGAVNSLKSHRILRNGRQIPPSEATTLTQVSGSTTSGTQAARRGKCFNWPLAAHVFSLMEA